MKLYNLHYVLLVFIEPPRYRLQRELFLDATDLEETFGLVVPIFSGLPESMSRTEYSFGFS